ncbi:hypothetical protein PQR07_38855 [Paraburkholderia aspalathi]
MYAGVILHRTHAAQNHADVDTMRKMLKNSKGPGNFRNLFMCAPHSNKDGIRLNPVFEVTSKDEFFNIKNVTRDILARGAPSAASLMGIVPSNTGEFGAANMAAEVFAPTEIRYL